MAAIKDLIKQVEDIALQKRLIEEFNRLTKEKKFGLVFEEHLPELTPLYNVKVHKGNVVAKRGEDLTDLRRVLSISEGQAECMNHSSGEISKFAMEELVVVARFGEPIFPSLVPVDSIQNGADDLPWHTLIEADNYHALQLLEYLYAGQVDCIYIDPPYNTGAMDWKYNNNYVDKNDSWRHSKWLAMMNRRLKIARRLLNPETGVLIVTIDEHEVHHLRVLIDQLFPGYYKQMITAVTNPKGVTQGRFSRVEENIIYCFAPNALVIDSDDNLLNTPDLKRKPRWKGLLRSGTNARRIDRKRMFYPIYIDKRTKSVVGTGETLPLNKDPKLGEIINGYSVAWPIRTDGSYGNWGVGFESLRKLIDLGYVSCGKYDEKRKTYAISYISEPNQKMIENGNIIITGRDPITNVAIIEYASTKNRAIKTVWHRSRHDAGAYGSDFVKNILGPSAVFSFPKSVYSVKDAINAVVRNNKNALLLDFFAGSGTTLNAVNLINYDDKGMRTCIMVTNNEVSAEDSKLLSGEGLKPGEIKWEKHGICQSITWPRSKYTIIGQRDDGSEIDGEYYTGIFTDREKPRNNFHIGFTTSTELTTAARKKQLVKLIKGIPQSAVKKDSAFIVSEKEEHFASVLFDDTKTDEWLEALADYEHIVDFYIVTEKTTVFNSIKASVNELMGSMIIQEEVKRPIKDGFAANLEYFRLEFLEKDSVELGRQFREILPLLWLRSGAVGPRPQLQDNEPIPPILLPEKNPFAVLVDETQFADFAKTLQTRKMVTHAYLVTDSEEAFQEMAEQLNVPYVIQLYRDYIENFMINKGGW